MNQKDLVMEYMRRHGGITAGEAYLHLGVGRLSARIKELRDSGHNIASERCQGVNRQGKKVYYDRYKAVE